MKLTVTAGFLVIGILAAPVAYALTLPANDGYVTDAAGVLTADQEATLERMLRDYDTTTGNQIAVLIVRSLGGETIVDAAVAAGRKWGVGKAQQNNGVLILMAHEDREVFIAPGYGLEGAVPDLVAKGIVERDMLPSFRDGNYYDGLTAGVQALEKHIGGEYTADRYDAADNAVFAPWLLFLVVIVLNFLASVFARTKSWWLGGIVGGVFGVALTVLYVWWWSIPVLVIIGLLFDYFLSRGGPPRRGGGFFIGGGGFGGRGGGGGFGGGSFGGGGAGGKW